MVLLWIWRAVWKDQLAFEDRILKPGWLFFFFFLLATAVSHAFDDTQSSRNAVCRRNTSIGPWSVESTCCIPTAVCQRFPGLTQVHLHKGKECCSSNSGKHFVASAGHTHLASSVGAMDCTSHQPLLRDSQYSEICDAFFMSDRCLYFICIIYCAFVWPIYQTVVLFWGGKKKEERQWGRICLWMSMVGVEGAHNRWQISVLWCCFGPWEASGCMCDSPGPRALLTICTVRLLPHSGLYFRKTSAINPSICASMTFHLCACESVCFQETTEYL